MPDVIKTPPGAGTSGDEYKVTGLPGNLLYVWTPPDGSMIPFEELASAKTDGNAGLVQSVLVEYDAEIAIIRSLAVKHFGQSSSVAGSEELGDQGRPELVLRVTLPVNAASVERWTAFHQDVLKGVPKGRMTPIVLMPDPRDAN